MSVFIRNGHFMFRCIVRPLIVRRIGWPLSVGWLSLFCGTTLAQNTALVIRPGTTTTVAGNNLVFNNLDLFCNGSLLAPSGTVWVTGGNNSSFNGTGTPNIRNLQLNTGASSVLSLNTGVQVSGSMNFQNGLIDLNGQQLQ